MAPDGREIAAPAVEATLAEVLNDRLDVPRGARRAARAAADRSTSPYDYSKATVQVGHGDRPQQVHRLQRVRGRLPVGEQHPGRRQGASRQRPRDALAAHRPLLHAAPIDDPEVITQPLGVRALRDRPLRVRLPGQRHRPQRRGPERDGLQPLHRHAVLQQQLPVQGPALQLPRLHRRRQPARADGHEPRRHRAQPRRDGEVHLLRAAHRAQAHRHAHREAAPSTTASCRPPASRPAPPQAIAFGSLNDPNSKVSQAARRPAPLRSAARAGHAPAHGVPGARAEPQPRAREGSSQHGRAAPVVSRSAIRWIRVRSSRASRPTRPQRQPARARLARRGQGLVGAVRRRAVGAGPAGHRHQLHAATRASAPGATTSRSAGPSASSTSSGGSVSATPAR